MDMTELLMKYERGVAAMAAWRAERDAMEKLHEAEAAALVAQRPTLNSLYQELGERYEIGVDRVRQIVEEFRNSKRRWAQMGRPQEPRFPERDRAILEAVTEVEANIAELEEQAAILQHRHKKAMAKHEAEKPPAVSFATLGAELGVSRARAHQMVNKARRERARGTAEEAPKEKVKPCSWCGQARNSDACQGAHS